MANITIAGQAVVVTSSLKLEDIKKVEKYRPDALVLKGGKDGKEPIFALGAGTASINDYGILFDRETRDDSKLATMTLTFSYDGDDIKEQVIDKIGGAIEHLKEFEKTLPDIVAEIDKKRDELMAEIDIIQ